jgi:hypothetical protein
MNFLDFWVQIRVDDVDWHFFADVFFCEDVWFLFLVAFLLFVLLLFLSLRSELRFDQIAFLLPNLSSVERMGQIFCIFKGMVHDDSPQSTDQFPKIFFLSERSFEIFFSEIPDYRRPNLVIVLVQDGDAPAQANNVSEGIHNFIEEIFVVDSNLLLKAASVFFGVIRDSLVLRVVIKRPHPVLLLLFELGFLLVDKSFVRFHLGAVK